MLGVPQEQTGLFYSHSFASKASQALSQPQALMESGRAQPKHVHCALLGTSTPAQKAARSPGCAPLSSISSAALAHEKQQEKFWEVLSSHSGRVPGWWGGSQLGRGQRELWAGTGTARARGTPGTQAGEDKPVVGLCFGCSSNWGWREQWRDSSNPRGDTGAVEGLSWCWGTITATPLRCISIQEFSLPLCPVINFYSNTFLILATSHWILQMKGLKLWHLLSYSFPFPGHSPFLALFCSKSGGRSLLPGTVFNSLKTS